ncbi:DUF1192 domain-containing protein [Breoghania sp. L-A4]|uniref:DUF1192 domain-containing protein n=1 Tax=Breoghania sp. L-A4 TaxID=2304600 RepID=UPI000E3580C6|nr:DUF1192 domain-containing protein [Breoghania sp. L-A4]AXS41826.1 DUF1192 domain-containing protein [Breoghania sp. L-A4]
MALFEDELSPSRRTPHVVGADLSSLSVEELNDTIALLRAEITRVEKEIASKLTVLSAANTLFKD